MRDESTRGAWSCSWSIGNGHRFEISNPKGTTALNFTATKHGMPTISESVDDPDRFMASPPDDYYEFLRVARRYRAEVERMAEYARNNTTIHMAGGGTRRPDQNTPPHRLRLGLF